MKVPRQSGRPGVVVMGEALVDIIERPDEVVRTVAGGSPANVAVGLGRLGRGVRLVTDVGNDAHGDLIARHLAESRVELVDGSRSDRATSTARATIGPTGAASYDFSVAWRPPAVSWPTDAGLLHGGSFSAVLEPGASAVRELCEAAHAAGAVVTYDPNVRPALMGDPADAVRRIEHLVARADLVKLSDEDAVWIAEARATTVDALLADWRERGPKLLAVTRGGEGSTGHADGLEVTVPAPPTEVVDTVGAGDTFMAGMIDQVLADLPAWRGQLDEAIVRRILGRGAQLSAVTVSRAGANPPWSHELPDQDTEDARS